MMHESKESNGMIFSSSNEFLTFFGEVKTSNVINVIICLLTIQLFFMILHKREASLYLGVALIVASMIIYKLALQFSQNQDSIKVIICALSLLYLL